MIYTHTHERHRHAKATCAQQCTHRTCMHRSWTHLHTTIWVSLCVWLVSPRAVDKHYIPASDTTHPQVLVTHMKEPWQPHLSGSISPTVGETRVVFCSQPNWSVPPPTPLLSLLQKCQETHQSSPVPTQEHKLICFYCTLVCVCCWNHCKVTWVQKPIISIL